MNKTIKIKKAINSNNLINKIFKAIMATSSKAIQASKIQILKSVDIHYE
jgi:hypothetical protein